MKNLVDMGLSLTDVGLSTYTPVIFCRPGDPLFRDSLDIFRHALDNDGFYDEIECFFDSENYMKPLRNLPIIVWSIPGALEVMLMKGPIGLGSYYQLPPEKRFCRLDWENVDPRLLLEDLRKGGNLDPAAFRVIFGISWSSSLTRLASAYFRGFTRKLRTKHTEEEVMFWDSWREIARWSFRGLSVKDLCRKEEPWFGGLTEATPTISGMLLFDDCTPFLWGIPGSKPRWLSKALLSWLEDAQSSGTDLVEYGRRELELYLADNTLRHQRWFRPDLFVDGRFMRQDLGMRLVSFTYGPEPQDWKLIWDLDAWEYAGDFWEQIENPPLHIPGAWVED
ncbi:hypothetical protein CDEST_06270 [Colletotrichum destructivum]|uniref:Uncharacterized protein n=1 Tax=Colletotrichum destructivum TaxID=34406 RepID=A0AAX4IDN5_9PEZI|nr:hypothetical protein CDEST_06270 [Colletotrichum destructivum]